MKAGNRSFEKKRFMVRRFFFWVCNWRGQKKFHLKEATENSITKLPKRSTETSDSYFLYASSMGQFRKILPFDHFLPPK